MILDLDKFDAPLPRSRVLVLGAGAAGIVLSVALARKGIPVLLCETGGRAVEENTIALNKAVVVGRPHQGIKTGRARVLGGTTTLWGGQLIAFREIDFQPRPWISFGGWPIDLATIAPYYEAAATMLGLAVRGDDDGMVWRRLGLRRPELGNGIQILLTRWLKETNLARVFRRDLAEDPNLTVLLHATATDFEPSPDGAAIRSVLVRSPGGKTLRIEADHVVVACGTIEANRLMLAAAKAHPVLPWAGNPWLGAAFQDHIDLHAGNVEPLDKKRFGEAFDNIYLNGFKYTPKMTLSTEVQKAHNITNVGAVFTFESSLTEHLSNLKIFIRAMRSGAKPPNLRSMPAHIRALMRVWWPLVIRYLKDNRAFNPADLGIGLHLHCEQKPLRDSRISLDPAKVDANGVPLAVLNWKVDGTEVEAMACFAELLSAELERNGLARLRVDQRILARDRAILAEATDTNHQCGGLQMAANPTDGVVDAELQVHGMTNLHIAGAAVFPSSSFANPTFTSMALALRLADRIGRAV
jgi:choline dehydrogenase-like flavoprotein